MEIGVLEEQTTPDGKSVKRPTEQGKELGIAAEKRMGVSGEYIVVVYDKGAQQFILDNMEAIVSHACVTKKNTEIYENQGKPWSSVHDESLVDLFHKNVPVSEIAVTLKRSEEGIRARLKKLGIINNRSEAG